jgi:hypothetical protein
VSRPSYRLHLLSDDAKLDEEGTLFVLATLRRMAVQIQGRMARGVARDAALTALFGACAELLGLVSADFEDLVSHLLYDEDLDADAVAWVLSRNH